MSQSYPHSTDHADAPSPASGRIRISHLTGSLSNQVKELDPGEIKFGRHPESAVRYDHITDFLVSTRHGTLTYAEGKWWFSDNNSTNGTYIGSTRIFGRTALTNGQVVVLGTPGATGSASFRAELNPSPMAETIAMDAPERIAQEPVSDDFTRMTCPNCKHENLVAAEDLGHAICERCNRMLETPPEPSKQVGPSDGKPAIKPSNDPFGLDSYVGTLPTEEEPEAAKKPAVPAGDLLGAAKPVDPAAKPPVRPEVKETKPKAAPPAQPVFRDFPVSPPRPPMPKPANQSLVAPGEVQGNRESSSSAFKPSPFASGPIKSRPPVEPVAEIPPVQRAPELPREPAYVKQQSAINQPTPFDDNTSAKSPPAAKEPMPWESEEMRIEPLPRPIPAVPPAIPPSVTTPPETLPESPSGVSTFDRPHPPMTLVESPATKPEANRGNPPVTLAQNPTWLPPVGDVGEPYSPPIPSGAGLLATPPETTLPPAVPPAKPESQEEGGFFGGIIGGIKSNIHRRRERKLLQQEVTELTQQLPRLESEVTQTCTALGVELWKQSGSRLSNFRAAKQLSDADAAVARANDRQLAVDREFGERTVEFQDWLAEWQEQASTLDSDLSVADAALTAAAAELARVREAIAAGYAAKAEALSSQGKQFQDLAAEAKGDAPDDLWSRLVSAVDSAVAKAEEIKTPIADLDSLLQQRIAAKDAVAKATARKDEVAGFVAEHRKEREEMDAAQNAIIKANDEHKLKHRNEVERVRSSLSTAHGDLGRQFVENPAALPDVNPPAGAFSVAKSAFDRLSQAQRSIDQKKRRLTELDAG